MYYTTSDLNVKIFLSLCEKNHLGKGFVIQFVNCVSQDMSVLLKCLVFPASQFLVQKITDILYA